MKRLYALVHKRLVRAQGIQDYPLVTKDDALRLAAVHRKYSYDLLFRFPAAEYKMIVKQPCFVHEPNQEMHTVQASKRLRKHLKVEEPKVCLHCPHKQNCLVSGLGPEPTMDDQPAVDAAILLNSLANIDEGNRKYRVWMGGVKLLDSFSHILPDLKAGGEESELLNQMRIKNQEERIAMEAANPKTATETTKAQGKKNQKPKRARAQEEEEQDEDQQLPKQKNKPRQVQRNFRPDSRMEQQGRNQQKGDDFEYEQLRKDNRKGAERQRPERDNRAARDRREPRSEEQRDFKFSKFGASKPQRGDRPERAERTDRRQMREERGQRSWDNDQRRPNNRDRDQDRLEKTERRERSERGEERPNRSERSDRGDRENSRWGRDREARSDRPERTERNDRAERSQRPERSDKRERSESARFQNREQRTETANRESNREEAPRVPKNHTKFEASQTQTSQNIRSSIKQDDDLEFLMKKFSGESQESNAATSPETEESGERMRRPRYARRK